MYTVYVYIMTCGGDGNFVEFVFVELAICGMNSVLPTGHCSSHASLQIVENKFEVTK